MSSPSTLPCRRICSCTPVTPKSSPAMYSILVDHLSTPIGRANSMVGARSGMTCSFQRACSSPRACRVICLPSVMTCSTWYLPLPTVVNSVVLAVDHQLRRLAAAHVVDEARELAADRHAQNLVAIGHVEIDRRLAGIGRRRDPQIGDHRRRRRKGRREGRRHAVGAPAAGAGDRHDQQQHRHEAQRPGVERGKSGMGRLVAEAGQALDLAAAMGVPQGGGHRIALAGGEAILHGDQRPVRHAAVALEPADRVFPRGPGKIAELPPAEPAQAQAPARPAGRYESRARGRRRGRDGPPRRTGRRRPAAASAAATGLPRPSAAHATPILRRRPGAWIVGVWLASIAFLSLRSLPAPSRAETARPGASRRSSVWVG